MKTRIPVRLRARRLLRWLPALVLAGLAFTVCADSPRSQALREQAAAMEQKARVLKADGRDEEAQQIMTGVRELQARADKLDQAAPGDREPGRPDRAMLKGQLAELEAVMEKVRAAGKLDQAPELVVKTMELRRALEESADQPPRPRPEMQGPRPGERPGPPPEALEMPRRLRHLQVAIDNLHAAGLHEVADRLAQEKERMMDRMRAELGPGGEMREQMQRLQNQVQELRRVVQELREQLDQLRRERR